MNIEKVKITRVTPVGVEPTYNMTMRAPHHNYFANGILTANSHSVCYGVLAYQTAYLKAHHPAHFWAAVLSNELNNTDKVARYIESARSQGIEILPPDVNISRHGFTSTNTQIRFGMMAIKGIGESAVDAIVAAREKDGPFKSIFDLAERVDTRSVNRRVFESLVKSGGLDSLPGMDARKRSQQFAAIEAAIENGARAQRDRMSGQASLFGGFEDTSVHAEETLPNVPEWTEKETLAGEKATVGFYVTGHPLAGYREILDRVKSIPYDKLKECAHGSTVQMGGVVVGYTVKNTKKGDRFGVFSLEDETGSLEVIAWPETFKKIGDKLAEDAVVLISGRLEIGEDGNPSKIIADTAESLTGLRERRANAMKLYFPNGSLTEAKVERLYGLFDRHRGDCAVAFMVQMPSGALVAVRPHDYIRVKATPELANEIKTICPQCDVQFS